jgi:multisubunit Na+/H+ antiporter MnhB subunit
VKKNKIIFLIMQFVTGITLIVLSALLFNSLPNTKIVIPKEVSRAFGSVFMFFIGLLFLIYALVNLFDKDSGEK